ncbi:MAG: hypothetical protein WA003_13965 [Desulfuromonadaceae bacterium]
MNFTNKLAVSLCILSASTLMYGCGSGSSTSSTTTPAGPSGKLTQGPVLGASVFADNVSGGSRFNLDSGEISATTSMTTGDFVLPSAPTYDYILVSKGGTDKLTGQAAIQMIAPAGSANITPITTLVALDTTGSVKAKLEALMPAGAKFDTDISTTASPAILLLAKSMESTVYAMTQSVTTSAGSATISSAQIASIQAQTMQAIAVELAKPAVMSATLQTPAGLTTSLQAAVTSAVATINNTSNTNINIPAATASTIAATVVDASATMLNIGATAALTTITGGEGAVVTSAIAATFTTAVTAAVTIASSTVTATATPTDYVAPVTLVVTPQITPGVTGSTGGTSGGTGTTF